MGNKALWLHLLCSALCWLLGGSSLDCVGLCCVQAHLLRMKLECAREHKHLYFNKRECVRLIVAQAVETWTASTLPWLGSFTNKSLSLSLSLEPENYSTTT